GAGDEVVGAVPAEEDVVTRSAVDHVVAVASDDNVVPIPAGEGGGLADKGEADDVIPAGGVDVDAVDVAGGEAADAGAVVVGNEHEDLVAADGGLDADLVIAVGAVDVKHAPCKGGGRVGGGGRVTRDFVTDHVLDASDGVVGGAGVDDRGIATR